MNLIYQISVIIINIGCKLKGISLIVNLLESSDTRSTAEYCKVGLLKAGDRFCEGNGHIKWTIDHNIFT